jgi:endo-alpha-1,4-polygalactosaminidase (GH114 family)
MQYLNDLLKKVKSDYKINQLDFVEKYIEKAFIYYKSGKNGQKRLEKALGYVEESKRTKSPATNFIVDSNGNVLINQEKNDA